jgi:hypothetical protein
MTESTGVTVRCNDPAIFLSIIGQFVFDEDTLHSLISAQLLRTLVVQELKSIKNCGALVLIRVRVLTKSHARLISNEQYCKFTMKPTDIF